MTWLENIQNDCKRLIKGCLKESKYGLYLYTPDGEANYDGLWIRDFAYMVEYANEYMDTDNIIKCIEFALQGSREDGWIPDRIYADGTAVYAAGETGHPIGEANLDTVQFLIFAIHTILKTLPFEESKKLFIKWKPQLDKALSAMPIRENGLVYNDPQNPHSPYGFTDTVCKTGYLFMESILHWRAVRMMFEMAGIYEVENSEYKKEALLIEKEILMFYNKTNGGWFAASEDCNQLDIWGAAYMLYIGFPLDPEKKNKTIDFLYNNFEDYIYEGQIRHLLNGEYWERLLIDVPKETYQNGAYWATATGWVVWTIAQKDEALAARIFSDCITFCTTEDYFECINKDYRKLGNMVVSGTNVLGCAKRMIEENKTIFQDKVTELTK